MLTTGQPRRWYQARRAAMCWNCSSRKRNSLPASFFTAWRRRSPKRSVRIRRTVSRQAMYPCSANSPAISRGERLVQRISGSMGEPAVRSATCSATASTNPGCASLADLPPPFFSDAARGLVLRKLGQVFLPMPHCLRVATEELGDIGQAAMLHFLRLNRRIPPPVLLRQRTIQGLHPLFDV